MNKRWIGLVNLSLGAGMVGFGLGRGGGCWKGLLGVGLGTALMDD